MERIKSLQRYMKEFTKYFTFSTKRERAEFEQQLSQDLEEIVHNAELDDDQDDNEKSNSDLIQNSPNGSPTKSISSSPESKEDFVVSATDELKRLAILDHIEEEFFKNVKHRTERFFVSVAIPKINIWTTVAYPDNEKYYKNTPVVCLHGFGSGLCQWTKLIDTLSQKRIVYLLDLPGFGKSSRPSFNSDASLNMAAIVDFLDQWRENVGIRQPFIVIGHSFGCYVTIAYSLRHANHVQNIFLMDPWGIYDIDSDTALNKQEFESNFKLYCRIGEGLASFMSPLGLMRKTGLFGKYILKAIKRSLYDNFSDVIDKDLFFDYWYYSNSGTPTGEYLFKSLQTNLFFVKQPMINFVSLLPEHVTVSCIIGKDGFVGRFNRNVDQQLRDALGAKRFRFMILEDHGHHFYAANDFIEKMQKISLIDFNDAEQNLFT